MQKEIEYLRQRDPMKEFFALVSNLIADFSGRHVNLLS